MCRSEEVRPPLALSEGAWPNGLLRPEEPLLGADEMASSMDFTSPWSRTTAGALSCSPSQVRRRPGSSETSADCLTNPSVHHLQFFNIHEVSGQNLGQNLCSHKQMPQDSSQYVGGARAGSGSGLAGSEDPVLETALRYKDVFVSGRPRSSTTSCCQHLCLPHL